MSTLNSVRTLIRKMSGEELKVARRFLTAFSPRGSNAPNQALKLFDLLCRELLMDKSLEDRELESLVYSRKASAAFPRLILRLRDKLYETLHLSVNIERLGAYSERARALYEIRKGISEAQILLDRGAWNLVITLLDECIAKASKYEHYEEWAAALRMRIEIRTVDRGKISFEAENQQYNKVIRGLIASKKALEHYHRLGSHIEFKAGTSHLEELQKSIDELQEEFEKSASANVAFFLHYLEVHFYQEMRLYKLASGILKRLAGLVEHHPAVSSPSRIAGVYINLAWNEICVRKFASALRYNTKVKEILPEKHFNYFQCLETEFFAQFYLGKYDAALKTVNELLKHDTSAEYRIGKREYQKACVLFMLGKHEQVQKLLTTLNPIEEDGEGWNLALRSLFIMNDIESEKTDNADKRIGASTSVS